jgi:hypothetical protein
MSVPVAGAVCAETVAEAATHEQTTRPATMVRIEPSCLTRAESQAPEESSGGPFGWVIAADPITDEFLERRRDNHAVVETDPTCLRQIPVGLQS